MAITFGVLSSSFGLIGIVLAWLRLDSHGEGLFQRCMNKLVKEPQRTEQELRYLVWTSYAATFAVTIQTVFNTALIIETLVVYLSNEIHSPIGSFAYMLIISSVLPLIAVILHLYDSIQFKRDLKRYEEVWSAYDASQESLPASSEDTVALAVMNDSRPSVETTTSSKSSSEPLTAQELEEIRIQVLNHWSAPQQSFVWNLLLLILAINLGARIFCALEGWTFEIASYFCIVSLTTIGTFFRCLRT